MLFYAASIGFGMLEIFANVCVNNALNAFSLALREGLLLQLDTRPLCAEHARLGPSGTDSHALYKN